MTEARRQSDQLRDAVNNAEIFSVPPPEPARRGLWIGVAAAIVTIAILVTIQVLQRHERSPVALNVEAPADSYAGNLSFTQLAMSQSTSLSGGTSTFLDGHLRNGGAETVTGVTVQVVFKNDVGLSPTIETLPLSLIRTHEPYIDTEPVEAAPLKPGDDREFRLIFEAIPANWNQQMPRMQVIHTTRR